MRTGSATRLPNLSNPDELFSDAPAIALAPSQLDGKSVALSFVDPRGFSSTYYTDDAIGPKVMADEYFASGGVLLMTDPNDPGAGDYVAALKEQLEERVTIVKVGWFDAALTWADPMANGERPHYLTWVDAGTNLTLVASRPPADFLNLARGLIC
jgi:hypothetical protein